MNRQNAAGMHVGLFLLCSIGAAMVMITHKLRMTVRTKKQREALCTALETSRLLYNAGLEERSGGVEQSQIPHWPL